MSVFCSSYLQDVLQTLDVTYTSASDTFFVTAPQSTLTETITVIPEATFTSIITASMLSTAIVTVSEVDPSTVVQTLATEMVLSTFISDVTATADVGTTITTFTVPSTIFTFGTLTLTNSIQTITTAS